MSLSQTVTKAVDEVVHTFIQQIATKYELDADELLREWEGNSADKKVVTKKPVSKSSVTDMPSVDEDIDQDELLKYKKPELQALCRQRGVKCTGTKVELVGYLLRKETTSSSAGTVKETTKKETTKKGTKKEPPVLKKLASKIPSIAITRNQFGNHEHPDTSLVFDRKTTKVIGKQNDDGSVEDLTTEDIDICKQYKFEYEIPDNLDKKSKLEDEKVEELDEDEDEDILVSDDEAEEDEEGEEIILDEVELIDDDDFEDNDEYEEEDFDECG